MHVFQHPFFVHIFTEHHNDKFMIYRLDFSLLGEVGNILSILYLITTCKNIRYRYSYMAGFYLPYAPGTSVCQALQPLLSNQALARAVLMCTDQDQ
jgi:hypothetical protein